MISLSKKQQTLQLDISGLSESQQRLIRYINSALLQAITTEDEGEYFNYTSEAMRIFSSLVKQAHFAQREAEHYSHIPYSTQALEFCVETIADDLSEDKTIIFDC